MWLLLLVAAVLVSAAAPVSALHGHYGCFLILEGMVVENVGTFHYIMAPDQGSPWGGRPVWIGIDSVTEEGVWPATLWWNSDTNLWGVGQPMLYPDFENFVTIQAAAGQPNFNGKETCFPAGTRVIDRHGADVGTVTPIGISTHCAPIPGVPTFTGTPKRLQIAPKATSFGDCLKKSESAGFAFTALLFSLDDQSCYGVLDEKPSGWKDTEPCISCKTKCFKVGGIPLLNGKPAALKFERSKIDSRIDIDWCLAREGDSTAAYVTNSCYSVAHMNGLDVDWKTGTYCLNPYAYVSLEFGPLIVEAVEAGHETFLMEPSLPLRNGKPTWESSAKGSVLSWNLEDKRWEITSKSGSLYCVGPDQNDVTVSIPKDGETCKQFINGSLQSAFRFWHFRVPNSKHSLGTACLPVPNMKLNGRDMVDLGGASSLMGCVRLLEQNSDLAHASGVELVNGKCRADRFPGFGLVDGSPKDSACLVDFHFMHGMPKADYFRQYWPASGVVSPSTCATWVRQHYPKANGAAYNTSTKYCAVVEGFSGIDTFDKAEHWQISYLTSGIWVTPPSYSSFGGKSGASD